MPNGDTSFKKITCAVASAILLGWLSWVSFGAIASDRRIAIVEYGVTFIQADIAEMKGIVKDIRQDQLRRERKENGK
jgi:hypothetical protein